MRLLGDIIFTIPAIQIYKKHFPDHDIYYVAEEKFKGIAELIPGIKKIIVIPYKMKFKDLRNFRKEIKEIGFHTVVDFHSGPKSAFLTFLTGIRTRIGYRTPNRNWAYNRLTPRTFGGRVTHSVFNQAMLLENLGIEIAKNPRVIPGYPQIDITGQDIPDEVKRALAVNEKKIAVHIGAGNKFRDWGFEKFSGLIKKLQHEGSRIFLIGHTEKEKERGKELQKIHDVVDFTGKLTIKETLYLISHSHIYFGIDSGPLHLASLTATPIVTVYGPNLPEISGPWRKQDVTVIRTGLTCRPCSQRKCIYDTIKCMEDVKIEEVYEAIVKYLEKSG
jgi:heptosyltransferase-1